MTSRTEKNSTNLIARDYYDEICQEKVAFYKFMSLVDSYGFEYAAEHENVI